MTLDSLHPVERAINGSPLLPSEGIIVVAVSGGADSMAMVDALRARSCSIVVAHFDHRLRDGSERDAALVESYAREHGLEFVLGVWDQPAKRSSLEQDARDARYEFLTSTADAYAASCVVTAHTRSDHVETILMRIVRGAGRVGLAGIPERRGMIVRPLLNVTRSDTRDYCVSRGVAFVDDPTNDDVRFFRNRVRHEILPALRAAIPSIDDDLLRVADNAYREQVEFAERFNMDDIVREEEAGVWKLTMDGFDTLDDEDARALLRDALAHADLARDVGRVHYQRLLELVRREGAGSSADLPGMRARREHDGIILSRTDRDAHDPVEELTIAVPGSTRVGEWTIHAEFVAADEARRDIATRPGGVAYFDADALAGPLHARAPRPGDRMQPFGLAGHKKLSDIFVDRKVPRRQREHAIVIEGESIHWIPGVATSETGRIGPESTRVVRLKATRT